MKTEDWQTIDSAPRDGTEFLARWTATEHGNRYMVIYWAEHDSDFFCGDFPVACMDSWCGLEK